MNITVDVLKFPTLVAYQKGIDKQCRPRSDLKQCRPRSDCKQCRPRSDLKQCRPRSDCKQCRPRSDCRQSRLQTVQTQIRLRLSTVNSYDNVHTMKITVDVFKFQTLVAYQKGIDKQCRPRRSSLIKVFPVYYSYKHFVSSSPIEPHFTQEQKEKRVRNFIVTV